MKQITLHKLMEDAVMKYGASSNEVISIVMAIERLVSAGLIHRFIRVRNHGWFGPKYHDYVNLDFVPDGTNPHDIEIVFSGTGE